MAILRKVAIINMKETAIRNSRDSEGNQFSHTCELKLIVNKKKKLKTSKIMINR